MTDAARALYAMAPAAFTATRDRLAAELRKAGRGADARAIARLRKPSAALWAVNQLARVDAPGVAAFVAAVERLRRQQLRDPRAAADTVREQRAVLDRLAARARELLHDADLTASPTVMRRITDTLLGAAVDRTQAVALKHGTLARELPAPGFEAFGGAGGPTTPLRLVRRSDTASHAGKADAPREVRERPASDSRRDAHERRAAVEQRTVARRRALDERRAQAAREAEALGREAEARRHEASRLETEVTAARAALADVSRRLREARQAARRAAAAAARAGRGR
ncbi:MAG TPA: hypothetical protein VHZ49_15330 [Methylomirabilota bacterium]|jgi:hypothetical protein|nr:hypothetical protein [Methylomirabilota bacterium]